MSNVNTTDRALIPWFSLRGSPASIQPGYLISALGNKQRHLIGRSTTDFEKETVSAYPHFTRSQWKLAPCTIVNAQGPSSCLH